MKRRIAGCSIIVLGIAVGAHATADEAGADQTKVDLTKIDRSIAVEPEYTAEQQQYCLMVFGQEADFRVWLVRDGRRLFVDRNGNGDLTDDGDPVEARDDAWGDEYIQFSISTLSRPQGETDEAPDATTYQQVTF